MGKNIIVGITGGIAAYKVAGVCSQLKQQGHQVRVMMTKSATEFITPLTFQSITTHPVIVDMFDKPEAGVSHIDWADWADCVLIAPATANIIGKVRHGIADDFVSTIIMATKAPVVFAPAMNVNMYQNSIVQANIESLKTFGYRFIDAEEGYLACGYTGKGRLAKEETIIETIQQVLADMILIENSQRNLTGKRVLITAGPTREALDPVRYITNHSSGKMGYAMAEVAASMGAKVTLISGPTTIAKPLGVNTIDIKTADEMLQAVLEFLPEQDIVIKAAAVADYRAKSVSPQKIKKLDENLTIELEKNVDILSTITKRKKQKQIIVGFAAESDNLIENARDKLVRKNMDLIVANDISKEDSGFNVDWNQVVIIHKNGQMVELPKQTKRQIAMQIFEQILQIKE